MSHVKESEIRQDRKILTDVASKFVSLDESQRLIIRKIAFLHTHSRLSIALKISAKTNME